MTVNNEISTVLSDAVDVGHGRRKIIIHLGLPEVAGSCISRNLLANKDHLKDEIYVFLNVRLLRKIGKIALKSSSGFLKFVWRWRYTIALAQLVSYLDRINFNTLIISHESILNLRSGSLFNIKSSRCLIKSLKVLDDALCDFDVTYVIYTRNLDPWRSAVWRREFEMRLTNKSLEDWVERNADLLAPMKVIDELYLLLGGRLKTISLEEELAPDRFLGQSILEIAGVSAKEIAELDPAPEEKLMSAAKELLRLAYENPQLRGRRYYLLAQLFTSHPELFAADPSNDSP